MSSNTTQNFAHYIVYMPYEIKSGTHHSSYPNTYAFRVPEDGYVSNLENAIRDHPHLNRQLGDDELILLKCGSLFVLPANTRYTRTLGWIRDHAHNEEIRMEGGLRLTRYFSTGPAPAEAEAIDVIAVTDSILESRDVVYALPDIHASKVTKDRLSQLDGMKRFPSPSEGVKSEEYIRGWANDNTGVHTHRPVGNYGPPTALFHPVLARLRHRLRHLDQIDEPSADHFEWAHKFLQVCNNGFKRENIMEGELKQIINAVIGEDATWQEYLRDKRAKPDAVWGKIIIRAILELKNVDGVGGNPILQATLDYAKILFQARDQAQNRNCVVWSNWPIILIGIAGSRLEISTAVFTDGIYSDKLLSEDFYIDAWQSETVLRVGRIFKALSLAIEELREYYEPFSEGLEMEATIAHVYPNPLPCEGYHIPRLTYIGKLSHMGGLLDEKNKEAVRLERPYALYRARMIQDGSDDEVDVVVKFTVRYHEQAHRILEQKELAPRLHFCIPLVGDMYMVIMDYIKNTPLYLAKPEDPEKVLSDVETAVDMLHAQDLVFGDLRVQNIVLGPKGKAMLIDFDWVGKHNVDRYPASWNNDAGKWSPSVRRRVLMDKAHDTFMLDKLRRHWEK
ncbi:hypothetical protein ACEPAF_2605 [Sanghuangporus sanghuang]